MPGEITLNYHVERDILPVHDRSQRVAVLVEVTATMAVRSALLTLRLPETASLGAAALVLPFIRELGLFDATARQMILPLGDLDQWDRVWFVLLFLDVYLPN